MLRRLWVSLRRDNLVNLLRGYIWITVGVAVFCVLLVRFAIPERNRFAPELVFVDQTADQLFSQKVASEPNDGGILILGSAAEILARLSENANSVGIVLYEEQSLPAVTLYFQDFHSDQVRRLVALSVEDDLRAAYGVLRPGESPIQEITLSQDRRPRIPLGQVWVPILLFCDPAMLSLVFAAALIFAEKEQGTLIANLVTPTHIWEYLLSKALSLALLVVLFGLILVPLTIGNGPNYLHLILMLLAGGVFSSLLGAWISIRFDNIGQFLMPAAVAMALLGVPAIPYMAPSFSPSWLQWLPSYPLVFGLREAVFPAGNTQAYYVALGSLLILAILCLLLASSTLQRHLARR